MGWTYFCAIEMLDQPMSFCMVNGSAPLRPSLVATLWRNEWMVASQDKVYGLPQPGLLLVECPLGERSLAIFTDEDELASRYLPLSDQNLSHDGSNREISFGVLALPRTIFR